MLACPLCSRPFPRAVIEAHAARCGEANQGPGLPQGTLPPQRDAFSVLMRAAAPKARPKRTRTEEEETDKGPSPPASPQTPKVNAFSVLMQAPPKELLVLDLATAKCQHFFLDGASSPSSLDNASWTGRCKLKLNAQGPAVDMRLVLLNGSESASQTSTTAPSFRMVSSKLTPGTLKSILQKAIRRRDTDVATRAAYELASKKWDDLVRRLPICILEDACLCAGFDAVVFLMLAQSAGLAISPEQVLLVVSVIRHVTKDVAGHDDLLGSAASVPVTSQGIMDLAKRDPMGARMVRCIQIRACMGGMEGDVQMCYDFAREWFHRFSSSASPMEMSNKWTPPLDVLLMVSKDSSSEHGGFVGMRNYSANLCAGVDYHCQPTLFDPIIARHGLNPSDFQEAMWHYRSSLRFRTALSKAGSSTSSLQPQAPPPGHFWHQVREEVEAATGRFLATRLS